MEHWAVDKEITWIWFYWQGSVLPMQGQSSMCNAYPVMENYRFCALLHSLLYFLSLTPQDPLLLFLS